MTRILTATTAVLTICASSAFAADWTLDAESSRLAFGSVKNGYIGEVHTFENLSGAVSSDGVVSVAISLADVQTNIDIRNERMGEHVFEGAPAAELTAQIDMDAVDGLRPGNSMVMELDAVLGLGGEAVDFYTEVFITRLSGRSVMVTTNDMVMLATDELGIDAGIDALQALAGLDSITRVSPITARFVFER